MKNILHGFFMSPMRSKYILLKAETSCICILIHSLLFLPSKVIPKLEGHNNEHVNVDGKIYGSFSQRSQVTYLQRGENVLQKS